MAKELKDHERAHTGKGGMKARHGQDCCGKVVRRKQASDYHAERFFQAEDLYKEDPYKDN